MAAAITTTNVAHWGTAVVTGTGFAANTAHLVQVTHPHGGVQTISVMTDGSGNFTAKFVGDTPGSYTAKVVLAAPVSLATASGMVSSS